MIHGLHTNGLPVVVTYHTIPFAPHGITDNPEVDGIIVCNPQAREAMVRRGWPPERIGRVQHGILPPCPLPRHPPRGRLAIYGFLAGQKGYSETMEAMQRLLPKHPNLRLTVFGSLSEHIKERQEAYYYEDLRREIAHRGLQDRVAVLLGFPHQDMLHHLLADHDILVLYYKGASGGYCESGALHTGFAASRPLIVSEAHHFDCSPETAPALLRASSMEELADLIDRLVSDPGFYFEVCQRVYEYARSRPMARAAQEYIQCFETMLAMRDRPQREHSPLVLLGVVVLSRSRTPLLDRAIQSVSDTTPGVPVAVVDTVGSTETAKLMREKWGMVTYICVGRALASDAVRIGVEALPAQYAKVVSEEDVMLRGWFDEHQRLCQRGVPIITCAGVALPGNSALHLLNDEIVVSTQICIHREALSSLGTLNGVDIQTQTAAWFRPLKEGGYGCGHVPITCFIRTGVA